MANICEHLNCLPGPGGLLDQDSFITWGLDIVYATQEEKRDLDEKTREAKRRTERR